MPMAKTYEISDCPVAKTLDLIGERWTILLMRDLLLQGPRRFQDFLTSLPGIAPNTLSARLKSLEDNGLVPPALQRPPAAARVRSHRQGKEPGSHPEGHARVGR